MTSVAVDWAKDDGGLNWGGRNGNSEEQKDLEYILEVESTGFVDRM